MCDFLVKPSDSVVAALWSRRGPPPAAHPRLALEPGHGLVQALSKQLVQAPCVRRSLRRNENGGRYPPTPA